MGNETPESAVPKTEGELFAWIRGLINREDLVAEQLKEYTRAFALPAQERAPLLLKTYFGLEDFISKNKPLVIKREYTKEGLRAEIRSRFPLKDLDEELRVVFLADAEQAALLYGIGARAPAAYVAKNISFQSLREACAGALAGTPIEAVPTEQQGMDFFLVVKEGKAPAVGAEVESAFKKLYDALHREIVRFFGEKSATDVFRQMLERVKGEYDFELVSRFVDAFPEGVLMEERVGLLSKQKLQEQVQIAIRKEKEDKERLDAIVSNLDTGIVEYSHDFKIMLVNKKAEEILGITAQEVVGSVITSDDANKPALIPLVQVLYPMLSDSVIKGHMSPGKAHMFEMKLTQPQEIYLQVVIIPLYDAQFQVSHYMKVLRDVSRDQAIAKSKSEFISVVAHQLRTPLSAVKWVFRLLLDEDEGALNPSQHELMQKGYDSNERMIELVNDMLDVARIEEGRFGFEFHYADLSGLIAKVVDTYAVTAKKDNTELTFEKRGLLPPLKIDSSRIQLVLQNLVDNALKYTPAGGKITVRAETIPGYLQISVQDTGIGIPKEEQSKMFTKFFRGTNALKFQTDGSGLGLFIIKNIIERHGGTISFESEEKKGTTFRLTLPLDARAIPVSDKKTEEFVQGLSTTEGREQ